MIVASRSFIFAVLFLIFSTSFHAQKIEESSVLLDKKRASVYIEFERYGKAEPLFEGENNQRIWLRLHNNSKWSINLCTFDVEKKYGDVGFVYEVKRIEPRGSASFSDKELAELRKELRQPIPNGYYSTSHFCENDSLKSGQSILFSVPRDHLARTSYITLYLEIQFSYEWENRYPSKGGTPSTYVFFGNSSLPRD